MSGRKTNYNHVARSQDVPKNTRTHVIHDQHTCYFPKHTKLRDDTLECASTHVDMQDLEFQVAEATAKKFSIEFVSLSLEKLSDRAP